MGRPNFKLIERANNPWFPLPRDYGPVVPGERGAYLSREGRRLARVNACMMQPADDPATSVLAWAFFRKHYLVPEGSFDPAFYNNAVPLAPFHYNMVYRYESHQLNAMVFPRGGGKTVNAQSYVLWKLLTWVQWLSNVFVSKFEPHGQSWMLALKRQIDNNQRIVDDFGRMRPLRDAGGWGQRLLILRNLCQFSLFTIQGIIAGTRGNFNLLDDTELRDTKKRVTYDELDLERVSNTLRSVIIPTVKAGGSTAYQGTIFHPRILLNHIMTCDDKNSPNYDETFLSVEHGGYWHKANFSLFDENGVCQCPGLFPPEHIKFLEENLGPAAFATEMLGKPISSEERLFQVDHKRHFLQVEDADEQTYTEPWQSRAIASWHEVTGPADNPDQQVLTQRRLSWPDFLSQLSIGITVDIGKSLKKTADYSVVHALGVDPRGDLYSLDLWADRVKPPELIAKVWEWAYRWRARIIGMEEGGFQQGYYAALTAQQEGLLAQNGWVPQCRPLVPLENKEIRIGRLDWRFAWSRIKLNGHRKRVWPYSMLVEQVLDFTPDNALRHDDCLDTLAMGQELFSGIRGNPPPTSNTRSPLELLREGRTYTDDGKPLAGLCDPMSLPLGVLQDLIAVRRKLAALGQLEGRPDEIEDDTGEPAWDIPV